jgi:hypothetical protein
MVYAWFDTAEMNREIRMMANSLQQLLMMVSVETREAEVILLRDPDSSAPGALLVSFSYPVLEML